MWHPCIVGLVVLPEGEKFDEKHKRATSMRRWAAITHARGPASSRRGKPGLHDEAGFTLLYMKSLRLAVRHN